MPVTVSTGKDGSSAGQLAGTVAMTLVVQALTAMALSVPAVLAPVAAGDFNVEPTAVGPWVGFSYMVAMFAGLAGGTLVGRDGPVRVLQVAVLGSRPVLPWVPGPAWPFSSPAVFLSEPRTAS